MENYFNYFTEIEERYRRCRATPTLLSPLDWALIESWKESGIPLDAVLIGVERSFEKFAKRPRRYRKVNSLAYCTQEVLRAAQESAAAAVESGTHAFIKAAAAPFTPEEIQDFLLRSAGALERAARAAAAKSQTVLADDFNEAVAKLKEFGEQTLQLAAKLENLESCLSSLEDKLTASMTRGTSLELLAEFRQEVTRGIASHRRQMSAEQIESLERQFLKKRLFEYYQIPRLSLFYL